MSNKTSHRKGTIFKTVLLFHACFLLFVFYINDWFVLKAPDLQEETPSFQEKEVKNEKKAIEKKAKDPAKKQRLTTNKIYLPTKVIEKQGEQKAEDVKEQPERAIEKQIDLASKEPSAPEKPEKTEDITTAETAKPTVVEKQNNIVHEKVSDSTPKQVSLPERKDMIKGPPEINKPFNFNKYKAELVENYKAIEGENIPLLLIDDHDKSGLYKAGLGFYGYQLIARPKVTLKEPYYFVVNNSAMKRIDETCPYTGGFPSAIQGDRELFNGLLSQSRFGENSNMEYELFYAPLDTEMLTIIKSKIRLIIENIGLATNEILEMKVTFKEVDSSYILIVESIVTANGERIEINDTDNNITIVG